jgi:hypothetical protein
MPVVTPERFQQARKTLEERNHQYTDAELLDKLRALLQTESRLSAPLIHRTAGMPCPQLFIKRFGSLRRAYTLIGYDPKQDFSFLDVNSALKRLRIEFLNEISTEFSNHEMSAIVDPQLSTICINQDFKAWVCLVRCGKTREGKSCWRIRIQAPSDCDLTIVVRMDQRNLQAHDFYLLPRGHGLGDDLLLKQNNCRELDVYRFANLIDLCKMCRRTRVGDEIWRQNRS